MEVNANAERSRMRFNGNNIVAQANKMTDDRELILGGIKDTFFNSAEKMSPSNPM